VAFVVTSTPLNQQKDFSMNDIPNDDPVVDAQDPWETADADLVREERNERIAATDWMVLPDSPAQRSMISRANLWNYRAALRDITKTFASPEDVVWPELEAV